MSLPARSDAPPKRAIDEAIRAIPIEWFKASPAIYWADLLGSAALGWGSFAAGVTASGWTRVLWLTVATFALYRAVLFIHERSPTSTARPSCAATRSSTHKAVDGVGPASSRSSGCADSI